MRRPSISCHRDSKSLWELQGASKIAVNRDKSVVENKITMAGKKAAGADDEQRERYIIMGAGGELSLSICLERCSAGRPRHRRSPPGPCITASGTDLMRESLHAAGRDFHVFNTLFRNDEKVKVRNSLIDASAYTCVLSSSVVSRQSECCHRWSASPQRRSPASMTVRILRSWLGRCTHRASRSIPKTSCPTSSSASMPASEQLSLRHA